MIFRQYEQVLNGTKTQTRRLRFPWELAVQLWKRGWSLQKPYTPYTWADWQGEISSEHIAEANRILAKHYVTLPIKPHRTAKMIGRIHAIAIKRENLQKISFDDACAELGKSSRSFAWYGAPKGPVVLFSELWNSIHQKPGVQWADNPPVHSLTFELAEGI